jgi:nucleoside-diphosphate-sugar epimerase
MYSTSTEACGARFPWAVDVADPAHWHRALLVGSSAELVRLVRQRLGNAGVDVRELQSGSHSSEHLKQACDGVDVVVHLEDSLPRERHAEAPFAGLLGAAAEGVRRFVLQSSAQVYAPVPPSGWPILEHFPRFARETPSTQMYVQRKVDEENALLQAAGRDSMEFVVLRPTEVFGVEGGFAEHVLELVGLRPAAAVRRYSALGFMQWVHIEDLADVVALAALDDAAADQAFTIAGPESFTVAELAEVALSRDQSLLRTDRPARFTSVKATAIMGWVPGRRLSDTLVHPEPLRWGGWRSPSSAPFRSGPSNGRFPADSAWRLMRRPWLCRPTAGARWVSGAGQRPDDPAEAMPISTARGRTTPSW